MVQDIKSLLIKGLKRFYLSLENPRIFFYIMICILYYIIKNYNIFICRFFYQIKMINYFFYNFI